MVENKLPTEQEFQRRFIGIVSTCGTGSAVVVMAYLFALLRFPVEQMIGLCWIVAVVSVPVTPISALLYSRLSRPLREWLRQRHAGGASREQLHEAFENVANFPMRLVAIGFLAFVLPSFGVVSALWVRYEDFGAYSATLMSAAVISGGLLGAVIEGYIVKSWLAPIRECLAEQISDLTERAQLIQEVSLATKLRFVIVTSTLVPVTFAIFLVFTRSAIPAEDLALRIQDEMLSSVAPRYTDDGFMAFEAMQSTAQSRAFPVELLVFDRDMGSFIYGDSGVLSASELRLLEGTEAEGGTGRGLNSRHILSWRSVEESSHVIVVATSRDILLAGSGDQAPLLVGLLLGCVLLALGVSKLAADDVGKATSRLDEAANRLAGGDLRLHDAVESEDELGTLSRSFQGMTASLNGTIGEVAAVAGTIESASSDIAEVSVGLSEASAVQGREVKQVVIAMEGVGAQIKGIAESSDDLNQRVEESTSSLLELGSSGEQLNQTASVLSERVEEVSSSVEQMVRSVREVGEHTETLGNAADETSSSMEEMASSMRLVDVTAAETSELSDKVVAAAELGQSRVRDTIEGIESIRAATQAAQQVIQSLGARAQEIGGILDVIDDVADETNLLALNAAIIAAQAGEHGRAFSVVADEIKELADRVLSSTKEIGGLIRSVQDESQSAITAIDDGSRSVAAGVKRSTEAGEALEEINRISRDSGMRIREIVGSVQEQTKAAGHVVELMDRVSDGVVAIRSAAGEQERGNQVVYTSTQSMREVAMQLHSTTSEQAKGLANIRVNVEGVRDSMDSINGALNGQSDACRQVVEFLEEVSSRSMANERSVEQVDASTRDLIGQAGLLRDCVGRFER